MTDGNILKMWLMGDEGREQLAWTSGRLGGQQGTPRDPHPHGCKISRDSNASLLSRVMPWGQGV